MPRSDDVHIRTRQEKLRLSCSRMSGERAGAGLNAAYMRASSIPLVEIDNDNRAKLSVRRLWWLTQQNRDSIWDIPCFDA